MSKQNQIKDFPQNSRKVKRVVIMNLGNSIALDLYRFLTLPFPRLLVPTPVIKGGRVDPPAISETFAPMTLKFGKV